MAIYVALNEAPNRLFGSKAARAALIAEAATAAYDSLAERDEAGDPVLTNEEALSTAASAVARWVIERRSRSLHKRQTD
jgi:hypothetical protein